MTDTVETADPLENTAKWLTYSCWVMAGLSGLAAWASGNSILPILALGIALAALATYGLRTKAATRALLVTLGLIGQPIALTSAFGGTQWQMDSHMLFFALLAVSASLVDRRAIIVATAAIAVHHLSLTIIFPALVYPTVDLLSNLLRTGFHGAVVVIEAAALVLAINTRLRMDTEQIARTEELEAAFAESSEASKRAQAGRLEADAAQKSAQEALEASTQAKAEIERERERAEEANRELVETKAAEQAALTSIAEEQALVVDGLQAALARLAEKDLTPSLLDGLPDIYDALRQDYRDAISALSQAIRQVKGSGQRIRGDSLEMLEIAQGIAAKSKQQSETVAQTVKDISDVSGRVRVTAEGAKRADQVVKQTHAAADAANETVQDAGRAMADIQEAADKIADVVTQIEEIAFQTNLLSLNAGIEAARAGTAGRGFAVVAAEVGALARRASDSAAEIGSLAEVSGVRVKEGANLVAKSSTAIDRIANEVSALLPTVSSIATAAQDQSHMLLSVEEAMGALDGLTRTNFAQSERSLSAAQTLQTGADALVEAIAPFNNADPQLEDDRLAS